MRPPIRVEAMPVEAAVTKGIDRDVKSDFRQVIRKDFPVPAFPLIKKVKVKLPLSASSTF